MEELKDVFELSDKNNIKKFIEDNTNNENDAKQASSGNYAQQASSGDSAKQASSGDYAQQASSGDSAQQASSGDYAQQASSGYYAQQASSGNYVKQASSGYYVKQASSGYSAQQASSGDYAQQASSGYYVKQASSGDSAQQASSGNYVKQASSGYYVKQASSGYSAQQASSGYSAQQASSGDSAKQASSGDSAKVESTGKKSVIAAIGRSSIAKARKGSWVTLAEYDKNNEILFVKTEFVDGNKIKEDTYYVLKNKEFREYIQADGIEAAIISKKGNAYKVYNFGKFKPSYIVKSNNTYCHGNTIKEARDGLLYKISIRDTSKYKEYTPETSITKKEAIQMYRVVTGSCEYGVKSFVEGLPTKIKNKKKFLVKEILELTKDRYGNETLVNFIKEGGA